MRDIHIWGGFQSDFLPFTGPGGVTFELAFYSNLPTDADTPYSRPGSLLWSRVFGPGEYTVRKVYDGLKTFLEDCLWVEPSYEHSLTCQYNFCIEDEPFTHEEGTIYWLEVRARDMRGSRTFGWKSTSPELGCEDAAVLQSGGQWYPRGPQYGTRWLDFAFVITGEPGPPPPPEACCFDDSTCQDLTPAECLEQGGIPQGAGTDCNTVICPCDGTPPTIVSGPTASGITQTSAIIGWVTDADCDSEVLYDRFAGKYSQSMSDSKMDTQHEVVLSNLNPSTVYHYIVQSTDVCGNSVTSRERFFETAPLPDSELPTISPLNVIRGKGDFAYWEIPADASDNIGVDRIEFYFDGELIGIDYSHPYLCYLIPSYMQMAREELFGPHTIEAWAIDESGMVCGGSTPFGPSYEVMDVAVDIFWPCISAPPCEYPGYLYTDDGAVPDGTIVEIQARAHEYEWRENGPVLEPEVPGAMPPPALPGTYVPHPVRRVEFYVNGHWQGTCHTPSIIYGDYVYTCEWDASGSGVGDYDIEARAIATDGTEAVAECTVEVRSGSPLLSIYRSVSRNGNYFVVTLTLSNPGTASAWVDTITDNVVGFQPIRQSTTDYSVTTEYSTTKSCQIVIDLFKGTANTIRLRPDESLTVQYSVVPMLYTDATVYSSDGIGPGYYYVEGTLNDTSGDVLDRKTKMFRLGICSGEITSFSATPDHADIADDVEIKMTFNNTGTVNITGVAVVRIFNSLGERLEEFRHDVANLIPSDSVDFSDIWNVPEAGPFTVVGHVLYDGKATDPVTVQISKPECFPSEYSTYNNFLAYKAVGKDPNCWCAPYQCDGDADGSTETILKYRIYGKDLGLIVDNWKRKIEDPLLDPCADVDHKSEMVLNFRVYGKDLAKVVENWKKKDSDLAGDCPRPE